MTIINLYVLCRVWLGAYLSILLLFLLIHAICLPWVVSLSAMLAKEYSLMKRLVYKRAKWTDTFNIQAYSTHNSCFMDRNLCRGKSCFYGYRGKSCV